MSKWLLSQVSDDLGICQRLTALYDVEVFCGLFMHRENEGLAISADTLIALGSRGIELDLDIYGPEEQD